MCKIIVAANQKKRCRKNHYKYKAWSRTSREGEMVSLRYMLLTFLVLSNKIKMKLVSVLCFAERNNYAKSIKRVFR